jgi:hypothetical protein
MALAGVVDDVGTAQEAAQRYNQRSTAAVVPMIRRDTGGVAIVARF